MSTPFFSVHPCVSPINLNNHGYKQTHVESEHYFNSTAHRLLTLQFHNKRQEDAKGEAYTKYVFLNFIESCTLRNM